MGFAWGPSLLGSWGRLSITDLQRSNRCWAVWASESSDPIAIKPATRAKKNGFLAKWVYESLMLSVTSKVEASLEQFSVARIHEVCLDGDRRIGKFYWLFKSFVYFKTPSASRYKPACLDWKIEVFAWFILLPLHVVLSHVFADVMKSFYPSFYWILLDCVLSIDWSRL